MNKLNPEFKSKWIAALRSGQYIQTVDVMKSNSGYCCLGVACVVLGVEPKGIVIDSSEG